MPQQQRPQASLPDPADPDLEVSLPGYQPVQPPPGPGSPDPLPAGSQSGPDAAGSGPGSSEPSGRIPTKPVSRLKAGAYEAIARGLLQAAGGLMNNWLATGEEDLVWIPDEEDEAVVPPPVGRLAARRIPIGDGENLTDLEDIGTAAVGLLAWAAKGLVGMYKGRRGKHRATTPPGTVVYQGGPGTGDQDGQP